MQYKIDRRRDLRAGPPMSELWPYALLVQGDADAALWRVSVAEGAQAVDLTGWTITAQVQRASGVTVLLTGSAQGSVASVVLDGRCMEEGGEITCRMMASDGTAGVTIDLLRIPVRVFGVGRVLDTADALPSLPDLLAQVGRLETATDAALSLTSTPAYIGENGNWFTFDSDALAYQDSGVRAVGQAAGPANLLDNSYFIHPVNQRHIAWPHLGTADRSAYFLDRWKMWSNLVRYSVGEAGLTMTNTYTQVQYMWQLLEHPEAMPGKRYTLACCYDGDQIACGTVEAPQAAGDATFYLDAAVAAAGAVGIRLAFAADLSSAEYQLTIPAGEAHTIVWCALYEGEYTAQTLPAYVYKGYAAELAECMRYFQAFYNADGATAHIGMGTVNTTGESAYGSIPLCMPLRVKPTVLWANLEAWNGVIGHVPVTALTAYAWDQALSRMTFLATLESAAESGSAVCLSAQQTGGAYLTLSAEL